MPMPQKPSAGKKNLLIELGTEELPPKALKNLAQSFSRVFYQGLVTAGVTEDSRVGMKCYATPRRLAVWVKNVSPKQPDRIEEKRGPALQAAYDKNGMATPAAAGFAKSCGVPLSALKTRKTEKGARLVFEKRIKGSGLGQIVNDCLNQSIKALPIPKRMRWGDNEAEFVRPVHWLLALHGDALLRIEVLGLKSDRMTRGHRFHSPGELKVPSADQYVEVLKTSGRVIADYGVRQSMITRQATRLANKAGANVVIEQNLLDEVTGLVEWPVALRGEFDRRFLELPEEVLISTMASHQKYFYVTNGRNKPEANKLEPMFIAISNIKSKSLGRVRQGNERVLRARLSDAEFFWQTDQKIPLKDRVEDLKGILFHNKLGSIHDKTRRIGLIGEHIAAKLNGDSTHVDSTDVREAAQLCKADLVTDMVGEFPGLQGVVGKYYARNQGIGEAIADAVDSHYKPRYAGDALPESAVAQCLALADRVDSLVGIFACGEAPTGDKDPFALRRAALGVFRIMVEGQLDLDLYELYAKAAQIHRSETASDLVGATDDNGLNGELVNQVHDFTMERSKGYFQLQGYSAEEHAAVSAGQPKPTRPVDFALRLKAIDIFFNKNKVAAQSLASANKRITNILSKVTVSAQDFNQSLVCDQAEKVLADRLGQIGDKVESCFRLNDYAQGLEILAELKSPIDQFFDNVMVMHEDSTIRNNRLSLLSRIRQLFLGVADISRIRISS